MTSLDHLLPGADEALRCSDHSLRIALRPAGTGIRADRLVLVETPLPWPKPVFDHPSLRAAKHAINDNPLVRLWARIPDASRQGTTHTEIAVFDRLDTGVRHHRYLVDNPDDLVTVARSLARLPLAASAPADPRCERFAVADGLLTDPVLLVCTQGSHDVCCGSDGPRFVAAAAQRFPELTIYRVSHTGGHRFAPTGMTFPDGRMWARLDLDMLALLLDGGFVEDRCRGWWGAEPGYAQTAEASVRAVRDSGFDAQPRTVTVKASPSEGGVAPHAAWCTVTAPDKVWNVAVAVSREVPTIPCRVPGGKPFKVANEYVVESLAPAEAGTP